jgi:hypothetical protein
MRRSLHHTNIGWRDVSVIRTQVLRFCGQLSGGPRGFCDQSNERIRRPISLSPGKICSTSPPGPCEVVLLIEGDWFMRNDSGLGLTKS